MRALVTGGGGFLGRAIVERLVERGWQVRILARGAYPDIRRLGVETARGDVGVASVVDAAVQGCDVVFHVAANVDMWGRYDEFYRTNVVGTRNVIDACRRFGVRKLVFTSSPSVVHNGGDIEGGNESLPYPQRYEAHYPQTKAAAERLVLAANDGALATVAIRPHLMWGPGDTQLVPKLLARHRKGALRLIGSKPCLIDTTYIDNAVDAHLFAEERLEIGAPCGGKAYFISQGEPLPSWDIINQLLGCAGMPPVTKRVPTSVAYAAATVVEKTYSALRLPGQPPVTRFLVRHLSTAHWYDLTAARRDLGYEPRISIKEGLERLRRWLLNRQTGRSERYSLR